LNLQGLSAASALALDPGQGDLYVSDFDAPTGHEISVFKPGMTQASYTLDGSQAVCLMAMRYVKHKLYAVVPSASGGTVTIYEAGHRRAIGSFLIADSDPC
jgi:hypothetical protein